MSQLRKDENENVSDEEYVRFFEEVLDDINDPDDAEAIHEVKSDCIMEFVKGTDWLVFPEDNKNIKNITGNVYYLTQRAEYNRLKHLQYTKQLFDSLLESYKYNGPINELDEKGKDMKIGGGAYSSFSTTTDKISYNYVYTNLTRLSDAAAEYEKKHSSLSTKGYGWDRYEFSKQLQTFADSAKRSKPQKDIIKAASRDKGQDLLNGFLSGTDKSLKKFESKLNQPVKVTKLNKNKANHK